MDTKSARASEKDRLEAYLAALERELRGYGGKPDRAAAVKKEITRVKRDLGRAEDEPAEEPVETAAGDPGAETATPPRPRRAARHRKTR